VPGEGESRGPSDDGLVEIEERSLHFLKVYGRDHLKREVL
jgi:hypothetical protein